MHVEKRKRKTKVTKHTEKRGWGRRIESMNAVHKGRKERKPGSPAVDWYFHAKETLMRDVGRGDMYIAMHCLIHSQP